LAPLFAHQRVMEMIAESLQRMKKNYHSILMKVLDLFAVLMMLMMMMGS
jgi:hypothetical protein